MRRIISLQLSSSNSSHDLLTPRLPTLHFSTRSRSSKRSRFRFKSYKTLEPQVKDQAEDTTTINSLFKEITGLLGAKYVTPDKTPSGFLFSRKTYFGNEEIQCGRQGVCENAEVSNLSRESQSEASDDEEISSLVHEITGIVRAGNVTVPMEERLEEMGFRFKPEVVDKVLKRCFKVPHLAFRFFTLVKAKHGFSHSTETYNTMLHIAGGAKEFRVVGELLEEMEKDSCRKDIKTWSILVSHYGKAKLVGKALFCFEKLRESGIEPDEEVYKVMVISLCKAQKAEIAFEFYKEMVRRNMGLDLASYKMLLNGLAQLGEIHSVKLVLDDMIWVSEIPERDAYVCCLKSYCVAGRIREALEVIRDLNNNEIEPDYECFEILVRGLCRADRITDALEIIEIMKNRLLVDGKVYGIIISGYLRRRELSKALDLFDGMKECGCWPITSTYTELMQHLFNLNEYTRGCELYDEMLERKIEIDGVAIMAILSGHVRQNNISKAWEVFKTMEDKGIRPTWKFFSVFMKELSKVSSADEMFKVLNEMQAYKVFIHADTFQWVISCMEKNGEMENVRKVKEMQRAYQLHFLEDDFPIKESGKVEQETSLNQGQSEQRRSDCSVGKPSKTYKEQDLQEACKTLFSSKDWSLIQDALEKCTIQFTPELVVEILRSCSARGNAALQFFSWVGRLSGYCHTTETYNMAMKVAGRGKDFKHMRTLFYEMRRKGFLITSDTWTIMIMQYGRTGLTEIALKIFGEMKATGCNPSHGSYNSLITCLCGRKGRNVDEAIKLFQEMIRAGFIPDKELVEIYLGCLCEVNKLSDARGCVDSLCKVGFKAAVSYSLYIRALCRSGRLEEALSVHNEVKTERTTLDKYTYGSLVHGLLRQGKLDEALARMDSMKHEGIHPTAHVYTSLIVHFFKEKQPEKALEIFEKMLQEGCKPTMVTYSSLIRGYMNIGRTADAWNVFSSLKLRGTTPDFKMYSMFISCLCKVGKSEEALQLISEMQDNGIVPSSVNYRTVFYGLNREGKPNLARTVIQQKLALKSERHIST